MKRPYDLALEESRKIAFYSHGTRIGPIRCADCGAIISADSVRQWVQLASTGDYVPICGPCTDLEIARYEREKTKKLPDKKGKHHERRSKD